MNLTEFRGVVDADLKRRASNDNVRTQVPEWVSDALRTEHLERWVMALRQMLASVEGQLELRANEFERDRAELQAQVLRGDPNGELRLADLAAFYHRQRNGALRFRAAVLEELPEAESLHEGRVKRLEDAIRVHRLAVEASTEDDEDIDDRLWSVLNQ